MKATPTFFLYVESEDYAAVSPYANIDAKMRERIDEHFYWDADNQSAFASFELKSMSDLLEVLKFYEGRKVKFSLAFEAETLEAKTEICLRDSNPKPYATMDFKEGKITPEAAASKLIAIAHALTRKEGK